MSLNKIYSRPRIKLKSKKQKIKFGIFIILIIILLIIIVILKAAYPVFISSCETSAASQAVNIVNSEVEKAIASYSYDDLVNIEKTEDGKVSYIEAKIVPINQLVSNITENIQQELDDLDMISVSLNFGSISGISCLSIVSPKFEVKLESAGKIEASIKSEFTSVGINQSLHRIYLNLKCRVAILTPFQTVSNTIENEVLLAETIIVGEIPETYYNFENLGFEDVLNMVN